MRKARIFLFLGTWLAILPYLGFPYSWKDIFTTITGLGLIFFSYILYRENKKQEKKERVFDNFKENNHFENKIENTETNNSELKF